MAFGLSVVGFLRKRLADIKADLEGAARGAFGPGIVTDADGPVGQFIGLAAAPLALLWELAEDIWQSLSPSQAEGVALDNVVELNNLVRLPATETTFWARLDGDPATLVGAAARVTHPTSLAAFTTDEDVTIDPANALRADAEITANDGGAWSVTIDGFTYTVPVGQASAQLTANALARTVNRNPTDPPPAGANGIAITVAVPLTRTITVGGNRLSEFPVGAGLRIFGSTGNDGLYTVDSRTYDAVANTTAIVLRETLPDATGDGNIRKGLTASTSAVTDPDAPDVAAADTLRIDVYFPAAAADASDYALEVVLGAAPGAGAWSFSGAGSPGSLTAVETGAQAVAAGVPFSIVSGTSGFAALTSALAGDTGRDRETDVELRERRLDSLQQGGTTVDAMRAALLALADVDSARVYENDTDGVVGGLVAHSIQAVVEGGVAQEIAETIFAEKAAGIATNGAVAVTVTDEQGIAHTMLFDRMTTVRMVVVVHARVAYAEETVPAGAAALIAAAIEATGNALGIGADVIAKRFYGAVFAAAAGLQDVDLLLREFGGTAYDLDESDAPTNRLWLVGDQVVTFPAGTRFTVEGSTQSLDGTYTVEAVALDAGRTRITTEEDITLTVGAGATGSVYVATEVNAIGGAERATFAAADVTVVLP